MSRQVGVKSTGFPGRSCRTNRCARPQLARRAVASGVLLAPRRFWWSRPDSLPRNKDHMSTFRTSSVNVVARLRLVLLAFTVGAPVLASAQTGTIAGRVVDRAAQRPIPAVQVRVLGTQPVAVTHVHITYHHPIIPVRP